MIKKIYFVPDICGGSYSTDDLAGSKRFIRIYVVSDSLKTSSRGICNHWSSK